MNKEIKRHIEHIEHGDWLVSADANSVLETLCINLIFGSKKGAAANFLGKLCKALICQWAFLAMKCSTFFLSHHNLTMLELG